MSRPLAPTAMRSPISRVRSVTETSTMFMMPIPPTNNDTEAMAASENAHWKSPSLPGWRRWRRSARIWPLASLAVHSLFTRRAPRAMRIADQAARSRNVLQGTGARIHRGVLTYRRAARAARVVTKPLAIPAPVVMMVSCDSQATSASGAPMVDVPGTPCQG